MTDMTPTEALATAAASADKTAIIATATAHVAALVTAHGNGTLTEDSLIQCRADFIDNLEELGPNLSA
tara:strand:+ start:780 stop:983 length:204 start_codon:yes stop_codon:yes gene_type:complete